MTRFSMQKNLRTYQMNEKMDTGGTPILFPEYIKAVMFNRVVFVMCGRDM